MKFTCCISLFALIIGCNIDSKNFNEKNEQKYCGIIMSSTEIKSIQQWQENNPNVYDIKNGNDAYSEVNDSIRANLPDSIEFELFLAKFSPEEICIDAIIPEDEKLLENLICTYLTKTYTKIVPGLRKIRVYKYTNPDGSGDSPFVIGIKSK